MTQTLERDQLRNRPEVRCGSSTRVWCRTGEWDGVEPGGHSGFETAAAWDAPAIFDRAADAGPLGHEVLKDAGDDQVLLADQEPRRYVPPQRTLA